VQREFQRCLVNYFNLTIAPSKGSCIATTGRPFGKVSLNDAVLQAPQIHASKLVLVFVRR
jgi:hypothetical protein